MPENRALAEDNRENAEGETDGESAWATISMGRVFQKLPSLNVRPMGKMDADTVIIRDRRAWRSRLLGGETF